MARLEASIQFSLIMNIKLGLFLIQTFYLEKVFRIVFFKFHFISTSIFTLLFLLFCLGLSFNELRNKKRIKKKNYIEEIEEKLTNFEKKYGLIIEKKSRLFTTIDSKLRLFVYKISLFKDCLRLFYLRIYINRALNKILADTKLRKLIKSEILYVPRGTFTEFLNLYDELKKELESLSPIKI